MSHEIDRYWEKIKEGDEVAFKVIYTKYFPKLYYFVYTFIPLNDIAENIVQDTFLTLWTKRKSLKNDSNLNAYLFTVAKNNCLYRLRDQRYRKNLFRSNPLDSFELDSNIDVLSTFDTSVFDFQEIVQIIEKTLEELPPQCKKVFILSRFEERKNKEIAEELNISIKAVEGHVSKGLRIFKSALKDYLPILAYLFIT